MPDQLLRLSLTVPMAQAEEALWSIGELCPEGFEEHDEPALSGGPPRVCFVAYAEGDQARALQAAMTALAEALLGGAPASPFGLVCDHIVKENWREAWKDNFEILHVDRFVIRPSWLDYEAAPGELVIHLDPGSAFGTGLHESTRLCLRALAGRAGAGERPTRIADFGCGTGILAIAALRLWPEATAQLVDNDPLALAASVENAEVNRVSGRLELAEQLGRGPHHLVLANVSRPVLIRFAKRLVAATTPGGQLVLSGLLSSDRGDVMSAFEAAGAGLEEHTQEGDWIALRLRRRSA